MAKKRKKKRRKRLQWKEIEALLRKAAKGANELDKKLRRIFEVPPGTRFG